MHQYLQQVFEMALTQEEKRGCAVTDGIVLPTQGGGALWQPRGQDHGQSPTLSLRVAVGTCPRSMKLEPTSECGSKQDPVLGQEKIERRGLGTSITVRG